MSNLGFTVNRADLPVDSQSSDPIPAGWYTATITEAEVKDTKSGTGRYIKLRFDVVGPSHQGRVVFTNLNIQNPNPKAQEIGHQQLGQLMAAVGIETLSDTDQLIGATSMIKVSIRKSDEYGDQNEVKGYKSPGGSQAPAPAPTASAPAASAPPWAR
jgi:hypothetical protein